MTAISTTSLRHQPEHGATPPGFGSIADTAAMKGLAPTPTADPVIILDEPVVTGDALQRWAEDNKIKSANSDTKRAQKHEKPVAAWSGYIFTVPIEDIESGLTTIEQAETAAINILRDLESTDVGTFCLQYIIDNYSLRENGTGKFRLKRMSLNAGMPVGPGDRAVTDEDALHIINGHANKAHLHKDMPCKGHGGHGTPSSIPFQYARYHVKEGTDWNNDPDKPSIAASPSDVFIHEFGHFNDGYKFTENLLQYIDSVGGFIDVNQNGINDTLEPKAAFKSARHSTQIFSMTYPSTAMYLERGHALQKFANGTTDYLPRSADNTMGSKQYAVGIYVGENTGDVRPAGLERGKTPD